MSDAPNLSKPFTGRRRIHVVGGGTFNHVRPHLALAAPAFGRLARMLASVLQRLVRPVTDHEVLLHLTWMATAGGTIPTQDPYPTAGRIITNDDMLQLLTHIADDAATRIVFMTSAVADFEGAIIREAPPTGAYATHFEPSGLHEKRLDSSKPHRLKLLPAPKIIPSLRARRKDVFVVACKVTTSASEVDMRYRGAKLAHTADVQLVLVNDLHTRVNLIVDEKGKLLAKSMVRPEIVQDLVRLALERT